MKKVSLTIMAIISAFGISMAQPADSAAGKQKPSVETTVTTDSLKEQVENVKGSVDGLNESYLETKATVGALAKIKVSGYIQAQWNRGDTEGVVDATNKLVKDRFLIKRGRLKTTYDAGLAKYVLEIDVTQDGVGLKDAYAQFTEPWLKAFSLTMGAQDRPFGYEVGYSSSMLESPERSKVIGTFFPKEKDIGAMLEFGMEEGPVSWLNAKVGVFNGQTNILNENDGYKDIIGRLGFSFPLRDAGLSIEGGFSGYVGKITTTDTSWRDTSSKAKIGYNYTMNGAMWQKNVDGSLNQMFDRQYFGGDLQLTYATPVIGGTCLKGEVIQGKQPGTAASSNYYAAANPSNTALYNRDALGYYFYFIQNIDPASLQLVFKYDMYDPNTKVAASDFTATSNLTAADIAYQTFGFGLLWYVPWAPNIRCMLFYEIPQNEKLTAPAAALAKYKNDLTDNLFTGRIQVKF